MNNLSPATFLPSLIALILVIIFYFLLKRQACNVASFKHFSFLTIILAFLFNFIWEMVQMPLFQGMTFNVKVTSFCALASVADGIMTLLLYYVFAFIYNERLWAKNLTVLRTIALMIIGGFGAIIAEIWHTSLGNWTYTESMPLLPFVNVGLSPILQFMMLPPIIFYLSFKSLRF